MEPTPDATPHVATVNSNSKSNSLPKETFSRRLVRRFATYFRWWHVGAFLTLAVLISYWIGIGSFLFWTIAIALLGIGWLFVEWLAEDKSRATETILLLLGIMVFGPVWDRLNRKEAEQFKQTALVTSKQARERKISANLLYWNIAVANLHSIRFTIPAADEPLKDAFERRRQELDDLVRRARAASTADVDQDLVQMARRHLEGDDRFLNLMSQLPLLMKQFQVAWGTETAGQGAATWNEFLTKLATNPGLWETIPPELQQVVNEVVELDQSRVAARREIEIMQAVLQERYQGIKFPLLNLSQ